MKLTSVFGICRIRRTPSGSVSGDFRAWKMLSLILPQITSLMHIQVMMQKVEELRCTPAALEEQIGVLLSQSESRARSHHMELLGEVRAIARKLAEGDEHVSDAKAHKVRLLD
jgi:hypothetical protein